MTKVCEPIYLGPPVLQRAVNFSVTENDSIKVNLCPPRGQVAFPQPQSVSLQKLEDILPTDDSIFISDCYVEFYKVKRRHTGSYLLKVVNRFESQVGEDTGKFTLDVECKY